MGDLKHEFAYSVSRGKTWHDCRRQHYLKHYLAWLGWDKRRSESRRKAYYLKQLTSMPILVGDAVHLAIQEWFNRKGDVTRTMVADRAVELLRGWYTASKDGRGATDPKKFTYLFDHHYGLDKVDDPEYLTAMVEKTRRCVENFFATSAYWELIDESEVLETDTDDFDAMAFELHGVKCYGSPDLACGAKGDVALSDWKCGKPYPYHEYQVAFYVFRAMMKGWVPKDQPERARLQLCYLDDGSRRPFQFNVDGLMPIYEQTGEVIAEMREVHFDAGKGVGDSAKFPMTEDRDKCRFCSFKEICKR